MWLKRTVRPREINYMERGRIAFPQHHQDHSNNVASCGFMSDLSVQIRKQCAYMFTCAQGEKRRILLRGLKRQMYKCIYEKKSTSLFCQQSSLHKNPTTRARVQKQSKLCLSSNHFFKVTHTHPHTLIHTATQCKERGSVPKSIVDNDLVWYHCGD